ncbi:MAG: PIN domain-containing protein [Theionarchaea archaeon]|nr:MAG: hypothetical protein AYK19_15830 [Theionarchaea archaeon DG-70-1]MBU7026033.1 PIN domain-containing protein [Theionarchaea archaeon]
MNVLIDRSIFSGYESKFVGKKVKFIFSLPFKFLVPNQGVFLKSLKVIDMYNLSFSGSVIAAHAVLNGLELATFDRDFEKVVEIKILGKENEDRG